jgi:hypothetical protein
MADEPGVEDLVEVVGSVRALFGEASEPDSRRCSRIVGAGRPARF